MHEYVIEYYRKTDHLPIIVAYSWFSNDPENA